MTSGQLYDKILASLTDEEAIDVIQQAKTEWCKQQRENCAREFQHFHEPFMTDCKKIVYNKILNAPEP